MHIIRIRPFILILFTDFLLLLSTSCNVKNGNHWNEYSNHIENIEGVTIDFYIPKNYTKELRGLRKCSPFFNDRNVINDNTSVIYFSRDEERSFFALSITDITEYREYQTAHNLDPSDSAVVKSLVNDNLEFSVRMPLIYQNVDKNGNRYYLIMYFTRYPHSEYMYFPKIENNTLPMDSVETNCYYFSFLNNKELIIEYYSLQSIEKFSFMIFNTTNI